MFKQSLEGGESVWKECFKQSEQPLSGGLAYLRDSKEAGANAGGGALERSQGRVVCRICLSACDFTDWDLGDG